MVFCPNYLWVACITRSNPRAYGPILTYGLGALIGPILIHILLNTSPPRLSLARPKWGKGKLENLRLPQHVLNLNTGSIPMPHGSDNLIESLSRLTQILLDLTTMRPPISSQQSVTRIVLYFRLPSGGTSRWVQSFDLRADFDVWLKIPQRSWSYRPNYNYGLVGLDHLQVLNLICSQYLYQQLQFWSM